MQGPYWLSCKRVIIGSHIKRVFFTKGYSDQKRMWDYNAPLNVNHCRGGTWVYQELSDRHRNLNSPHTCHCQIKLIKTCISTTFNASFIRKKYIQILVSESIVWLIRPCQKSLVCPPPPLSIGCHIDRCKHMHINKVIFLKSNKRRQ